MVLVTSAPSTAPSYLGSWSRKDLVSLGYPAAFCLGFYPDVDSWSHVAGALCDVGCAVDLDLSRSPRTNRFEVVDDEGDLRVLEDVLVLHGVFDIAAADVEVLAVKVEAHNRHIRPTSLGSGTQPSERLRLQVGLLFFGKRYLPLTFLQQILTGRLIGYPHILTGL